jgi:UDP-N-acetylglucosamine 4-epimerase
MDIRDLAAMAPLFHAVDYVLHQAALGSVPGSIDHPLGANDTNVTGFLNVLTAARDADVQRFVYASSSAIYGDEPTVPKLESMLDEGLSPYAVNKQINELYARVYSRCYGIQCVGLRYFNVFGPRQDPNGAYAAVIPRWISALIKNEHVVIFGDGHQTRDFCHIDNVVQANLRAALVRDESVLNTQYNIANGECTDLNTLFATLRGSSRQVGRHPRGNRHHHPQDPRCRSQDRRRHPAVRPPATGP